MRKGLGLLKTSCFTNKRKGKDGVCENEFDLRIDKEDGRRNDGLRTYINR